MQSIKSFTVQEVQKDKNSIKVRPIQQSMQPPKKTSFITSSNNSASQHKSERVDKNIKDLFESLFNMVDSEIQQQNEKNRKTTVPAAASRASSKTSSIKRKREVDVQSSAPSSKKQKKESKDTKTKTSGKENQAPVNYHNSKPSTATGTSFSRKINKSCFIVSIRK